VNEIQQWVVTNDQSGLRLDTLLGAAFPFYSRREVLALISTGQVFLNGRPAKKGIRVRTGDTIVAPSALSLHPNPDLPIEVVHADDAIIVLDKPTGIPSLALRHDETNTVANFLGARFPQIFTAGVRHLEAGLVHRLDTATSGLLLVARTSAAHLSLRKQFRAHTVEKDYLALVEGKLQASGQFTVDLAPTGPRGKLMRAAVTGARRESRSSYTSLEIFPRHTLVKIRIITGVRHQIRAHLAMLGHPIVGDTNYGAGGGAARLYLHAQALAFTHPTANRQVRFTSPLPPDFLRRIETLRARREEHTTK